MKRHAFAGRTGRRAEGAVRQHWPAGRNAASLAPPASGIDFADRGLPERLRAGIESLSGMDLSDVRVHANSEKPAQLNALAYAQGNDIHLGPGQERSLPHEAWHVVQQRQGRVKPTLQMHGSAVNDDAGLEREADAMGAKALQAKVDLAAAGTRNAAVAPVIQRDVGFEYETNVDTYLAAVALNNAQRHNGGAFPPGAQPLGKGNVLVTNMNGLHAKADLGGAGLGSNLEFETDSFSEDGAGRLALHRALKNLERFCGIINARHAATPHMRSSHLAAAFGGNAPTSLRYIRAIGNVTGNPQASVGVRLDKIEELMEETVGGPTGGLNMVGVNAPQERFELGAQNAPDFANVGDAPATTRTGIANYRAAYAGGAALPAGPSDDLVGLCALLLSYIVRGTVQSRYAKQIAPLMARTEFGTIFADLPPPEQGFFSAAGGAEFLAMFGQIVALAPAVGGGLGGQLFQFEPLRVANLGLNISTSLTRQAWLAGITQGTDLLTQAHFPSVNARPQMFGLGGFGPQQDPDPTGGGTARQILELRRMIKTVAPHDFTEMAMGVFDYIVDLNAGNHPVYGHVARPNKQPKIGQLLRYWRA